MEGLDVWFGFGTVLSIISFVIAMILGPIGSVAIAIIGFVGATDGWGWEWWQAALLCFPFVIVSIFAFGVTGIFSLFQRREV